jgi:hypothetical protein
MKITIEIENSKKVIDFFNDLKKRKEACKERIKERTKHMVEKLKEDLDKI